MMKREYKTNTRTWNNNNCITFWTHTRTRINTNARVPRTFPNVIILFTSTARLIIMVSECTRRRRAKYALLYYYGLLYILNIDSTYSIHTRAHTVHTRSRLRAHRPYKHISYACIVCTTTFYKMTVFANRSKTKLADERFVDDAVSQNNTSLTAENLQRWKT
jgi:hypothetical protein